MKKELSKNNKIFEENTKITIDKENKIPYYLQVKDRILSEIKQKNFMPGVQLNNEFELSDIFDVSRPTIRQALKELEIESLIKKVKGSGTFVSEKKYNSQLFSTFYSATEDLINQHSDFINTILVRKLIEPDAEKSAIFKIQKNEGLNYIERLRVVGNKPYSLTIFYVNKKYCPDFINSDLEHYSSFYIWENIYKLKVSKVKRILDAVNYDYLKKPARLLKIKNQTPMFFMKTYIYINHEDILLCYSEDYFSSETHSFTFTFNSELK